MTATQPDEDRRQRSYQWDDPAPILRMLPTAPGIEVLRALASGQLPPPPIMQTIGFASAEFELGRARFSLHPSEFHYNPLGTVHGGVIATLLDSATGCAVHSVLAAGEGYTSVDLTTKYLRPITAATGLITAEGTVIQRGARTALAQAQLTDSRGKVLAHATSTCLIFPLTAG
jgi:uncharacterized protein (TIGR00369 family)